MYTIEELNLRLLSELKDIAEELGVKNYKRLSKKDLIYKILDQQAILPENELPKKRGVMSNDGPSAKENEIEIQVIDNGPGIPKEVLPKIFEPSFTTKSNGLSFGLGLGLPTVQRLVESYNGKIKVETKPGNTTFTVSIPISNS